MVEQDASHSPHCRQASSTQACRATRGSATASRSCIDKRVCGIAPKYAGAGSGYRGVYSLGGEYLPPRADRNAAHLMACSSVLVRMPHASFLEFGQAMRTIEVTSVAPRAWACCNASSADAAWRVCSARKVTVNWRGSPERLTSAVRARRLWVGTGLGFAAGVSIGAATRRAAGRERGPPTASAGPRSTSYRRNRRLRCLRHVRCNRLAISGAAGRQFQSGTASSVGRTILDVLASAGAGWVGVPTDTEGAVRPRRGTPWSWTMRYREDSPMPRRAQISDVGVLVSAYSRAISCFSSRLNLGRREPRVLMTARHRRLGVCRRYVLHFFDNCQLILLYSPGGNRRHQSSEYDSVRHRAQILAVLTCARPRPRSR